MDKIALRPEHFTDGIPDLDTLSYCDAWGCPIYKALTDKIIGPYAVGPTSVSVDDNGDMPDILAIVGGRKDVKRCMDELNAGAPEAYITVTKVHKPELIIQ